MNRRPTDERDKILAELADSQQASEREAVLPTIQAEAEQLWVTRDVEQFADYALVRYKQLLGRFAQ